MLSVLVAGAHLGMTFQCATVDITPPELLPLGGYTARQGKVADPGGRPLYARAVSIGGLTLVALDMLTIPEGFYQAVRDRTGVQGLWLVATHTHCAPDSQMLNPKMTFSVPGIASYSGRWFRWYVDRVSDAVAQVREAPTIRVRHLSLARVRVRLNHGRRAGSRPDPTGWALEADGKPILASYAAHATFFDESWNRTEGDWPARLAERIGAPVVPGPIGDVAPEADGRTAVEKCDNFVEKFCRAIACDQVMGVWPERSESQQSAAESPLGSPVPHPTFAKVYGVPEVLAQVLVNGFAQRSCRVVAASFGKFAIVGVPGEPTAELGRQIQAQARRVGFPHCLVVSHVNGWVGYILEPPDYDRGGYEATLSFNGRNTADTVLETAGKALEGLRVRDPVSHQSQRPGRGSARAGS